MDSKGQVRPTDKESGRHDQKEIRDEYKWKVLGDEGPRGNMRKRGNDWNVTVKKP